MMSSAQQQFDFLDFLFLLSFYVNTESREKQGYVNEMLWEDHYRLLEVQENQQKIIQDIQKILDRLEG